MSYREDAREIKRESNWTFWQFLPLFLVVIVIISAVGFGLKSIGLIGSTVVEREVFERSYQRSAAIQERIAVDEAQLAEINRQLMNSTLDEGTRVNLEAQKSAINVRIATAKGLQQ